METLQTYKNFTRDKSIDELRHDLLQHKIRLENLEKDLVFLQFLLTTNIFKPRIINLFEKLTHLKKDLDAKNKTCTQFLNRISSQINQVTKKIECEDLICDNFFIKEYNALELEIYSFIDEMTDFKTQIFQYVQSVIIY
jgi:predicted  nucleic acid-binding Zn-ribbon protein